MSNTINIITELCQEDRQRLDDLLGGIASLTAIICETLPKAAQERIIEETVAPMREAEVYVGIPVEGAAHLEPVTVEATPAPVEEPKVEDSAPVVISLAEFQKAVTLAVSKGPSAKAAVKTIINKYAPSVSGVPEDKRAEVMAELSKI